MERLYIERLTGVSFFVWCREEKETVIFVRCSALLLGGNRYASGRLKSKACPEN